MTDLEPARPTELVLPHTGELVNLTDPTQVANAIDSVRDYKWQLDQVRAHLIDVLVQTARHHGTKTLHLDGLDVTITGGERTVYDHVELTRQLRDAGLPEEVLAEAIEEIVAYKPNARRLKRLAMNPAYAEIIAANSRVEPAPWGVTIRRP